MLASDKETSDTSSMARNDFRGDEYHYPPIFAQITTGNPGTAPLSSVYVVMPEHIRYGGRDLAEPLPCISYAYGGGVLALIATSSRVRTFGEGESANSQVTQSLIGFLSVHYSPFQQRNTFTRIDRLVGNELPARAKGAAKFILAHTESLHPSVGGAMQKLLATLRPQLDIASAA